MYGWRGRIGLLIPANNTVIEPELNKLVPPGVCSYATRMIVEGAFEPEALHRMEIQAARGIKELMLSQVDIVVYACMSTSLAKGRPWDSSFCLQETGQDITIMTAAQCTARALLELQVRNVAVLTPYPVAIQSLLSPYLAEWGLSINDQKSLNISDYHAVTRISPESLYREALALNRQGAEALCIMATDLRTLEIITALEKDIGIPVVSTNLAIYWASIKDLGVREEKPALDCALLRTLR